MSHPLGHSDDTMTRRPIGGHAVGYAALKLRTSVLACCWLLAVPLILNILVWSVAAFTDMRTTIVEPDIDAPLVVKSEEARRPQVKPVTSTAVSFADTIKPVAVHTQTDQVMSDISSVSGVIGVIACLVLGPLVMVGVIVGCVRNSAGVHLTLSAFIWTAVLGVLTLPLKGVIDLPWQEPALRSYTRMTAQVDLWIAGGADTVMVFAQGLALPIACLIGTLLVGVRFSRGIEPMLPENRPYFDPELEREAANRQAGTLHGGRTGAALSRVMSGEAETKKSLARTAIAGAGGGALAAVTAARQTAEAKQGPDELPSARTVTAGTRPKRLI